MTTNKSFPSVEAAEEFLSKTHQGHGKIIDDKGDCFHQCRCGGGETVVVNGVEAKGWGEAKHAEAIEGIKEHFRQERINKQASTEAPMTDFALSNLSDSEFTSAMGALTVVVKGMNKQAEFPGYLQSAATGAAIAGGSSALLAHLMKQTPSGKKLRTWPHVMAATAVGGALGLASRHDFEAAHPGMGKQAADPNYLQAAGLGAAVGGGGLALLDYALHGRKSKIIPNLLTGGALGAGIGAGVDAVAHNAQNQTYDPNSSVPTQIGQKLTDFAHGAGNTVSNVTGATTPETTSPTGHRIAPLNGAVSKSYPEQLKEWWDNLRLGNAVVDAPGKLMGLGVDHPGTAAVASRMLANKTLGTPLVPGFGHEAPLREKVDGKWQPLKPLGTAPAMSPPAQQGKVNIPTEPKYPAVPGSSEQLDEWRLRAAEMRADALRANPTSTPEQRQNVTLELAKAEDDHNKNVTKLTNDNANAAGKYNDLKLKAETTNAQVLAENQNATAAFNSPEAAQARDLYARQAAELAEKTKSIRVRSAIGDAGAGIGGMLFGARSLFNEGEYGNGLFGINAFKLPGNNTPPPPKVMGSMSGPIDGMGGPPPAMADTFGDAFVQSIAPGINLMRPPTPK